MIYRLKLSSELMIKNDRRLVVELGNSKGGDRKVVINPCF
jgi:hypothetical protein